MKKLLIPLLILAAARAEAQAPTCTGGLGDPIVDITFGSGVGFGPALPAGVTNMQYVAITCPEDGQYTITHAVSGCYNGSWLNVPGDHTGNPNGYFMLINASYDPSDFYVQTIGGLCPGTTYQFAAWVLNMVDFSGELEPNITFTIENASDGSVLGTYNTNFIPEVGVVQWVQYGFFFNTPPGVSSVILKMTNNASGGNGNDLGIDDITFRAAGPSVQPSVTGFTGDSLLLCQNDTRTLGFDAVVGSCYPTASYQWQVSIDSGVTWADIAGATQVSYTRPTSAPGYYLYRLTVAQTGNIGVSSCEVASMPILVSVVPNPSPAVTIAPGVASSCAGMPVVFTATPDSGGPGPVYQWFVNGVGSGSGGPSFTTSSLASSDVVSCVLTSDAVCVLNPVVTSNAVSITVTPIPVSSVSVAASAGDICQDSTVVFTATPANGGTSPLYQWSVNGVAAGGDSASFVDSNLNNGDVVNCIMTAGLTCAVPDTAAPPVTMVVYPLPVIGLTPDTVIAGGQQLRLSPTIGGTVVSYSWTPATGLDNPGVPDPVAMPVGSTTYRLTVVSDHGCVESASEVVGVFYQLAMPGAFTPNGDGRNDIFRVPPSVPVAVLGLSVYSREGLCVFSGVGSGAGWDGKFDGHPQPAGEYVWMLEWVDPLTNRMERSKGTVILVR